MTISDETLSAFIDGELAPSEAERLGALIARDAELAARVERLRRADSLLREGFEPLAVAPPALRIAAGASPAHIFRRYAAPAAAALAACAAAFVFGLFLRGDGADRLVAFSDGLVAGPELARALVATQSGEEARAAGFAVTPIYSFRAQDGRACRVFRAVGADVVIEGAACREARAWRVLALAPAPARSSTFALAGDAEPAAIAATVEALSDGVALEPDAERALIARGWRPE